MLRLIVFLVVAAALAYVGVYLANHPGNVAIEWQGRRLETSVGIAILAALAFALAVALLLAVLRWLARLPVRARENRRHANEVRGYRALTGGLVAAAAGDLGSARALQREAERLLPERGSVLVLAAQSAQLEGREDEAHLKFRQMLRSPETELLGLRGLLAQALRTGDRDEALSLTRRAYRRSPTTPWVLTTLFDLLTRSERWEEALNLVPEMVAQGQTSEDEARRHRAVLHHMQAATLRDDNRPQEALAQARRGLKLLPASPPAAVLGAELAGQQGKRRLAVRLLEDAWRGGPHPDLAQAYARLVEGESPEQRLQRVEKRLKPLRPDHPELHLALGELAISAGRHQTARDELERALALEPTPRAYRLLAELERAEGRPERADEWLSRAGEAQPDHAWVCEDTGETLPEWRPFGASGRFGVVRWAVPARVAALQGPSHGAFLTADKPQPPAADAAAATPADEGRATAATADEGGGDRAAAPVAPVAVHLGPVPADAPPAAVTPAAGAAAAPQATSSQTQTSKTAAAEMAEAR